MSKVIEFMIAPNNMNLHEDFLMRIPSINVERSFDTYYFWDGKYKTDSYEVLIPIIESYLIKCRHSIFKLLKNESIYLPIDFSDQYYGIFEVTFLLNNTYELKYGTVDKTNKTSFLEDADTISFVIGDSYFDVDFKIVMQFNDIVESFILTKYN